MSTNQNSTTSDNELWDTEGRDPLAGHGGRVWLNWEGLTYKKARYRMGLYRALGFSPDGHETVLSGVSGSVGPGELVAVVGEQRTGKSLLLGLLAGLIRLGTGDVLSGRVMANGRSPRETNWRRLCGFVTQQPRAEQYGLLTVEEQLRFTAALALPASWPLARRRSVLEHILRDLELQTIREWPVERISACEQKRLSLAQILLSRPRIILIDEPNVGLDAATTLDLMRLLRSLAERRQIGIVVALQQLRQAALPLIDRVLILAGGGTVYYGGLGDAQAYFSGRLGVNLLAAGDHILAAILDAVHSRRGRTAQLHAAWNAYSAERGMPRANAPEDAVLPHPGTLRRTWLVEFGWQLRRSWTSLRRDYVYTGGQVGLAMVLCLLTSFSAFRVGDEEYYLRARMSILYFTCVFFQFFPFVPFLLVFHRDLRVLQRERLAALSRVSPLYVAVWTVIFGFRVVMVTAYAWILYFIVGLRLPLNYTLVFWLTLLAEAWTAMAMGVLIVIFIPSLAIAETVASTILLVCIWFSGDFAFNPACTWILRWIAYLSPIFYAYNAVVNNEFDGQTFTAANVSGENILKALGLDNIGVWGSIGALLGFGAVYTILGYFALRFVTQPRLFYD